MPLLTEPWDDPDAEREVLVDLLVPAAQAQHDQALNRWSALDAKAFNLLALVTAIIAGLATFHEEIHHLWWAGALGFAAAGGFFVRTVWPRPIIFGPDLTDFHDEMRAHEPFIAARTMVESLTDAADSLDEGYADKGWNFQAGLLILVLSLLGSVPVLWFRP